MKKIVVSSLLPGLLLAIADIVTIVFAYAVCSLVSSSMLPAVFFAVVISLLALNGVVLGSSRLAQRFGKKAVRLKTVATVLYFLIVLGFTLTTFLWIQLEWYVTVSLLVTAVYLSICAGALLFYRNKSKESRARQTEEVAKIRLFLLPIAHEIRESRKWLEAGQYYRLSRKFSTVEHRLSGAVFVNETANRAVGQVEGQIVMKLTAVRSAVQRLSLSENVEETLKTILALLEEIEYLAKSKEMILVETGSLSD